MTSDMTLAAHIESYLLSRATWVPARELCERFGVRERELRALDDRPGLCSQIAISGNKGFKHIALATTDEWQRHYARERKHSIMALVNLRQRRRHRERILSTRRPLAERDTGQFLFPFNATLQ